MVRQSRANTNNRNKAAYRGAARSSRPPVTSTSICDHCPHMRKGHRVRTGQGECKTEGCTCPGFSYDRPAEPSTKVAYRFLTEAEVARGKALLEAGLTYHETARKLGNMSWEGALRRRFPEFKKGRPNMWDTQVLGERPDQEAGDG